MKISQKAYIIMSVDERLVCVGKYPCGPILDYMDPKQRRTRAKVRMFPNYKMAETFAKHHFEKHFNQLKVVECNQLTSY